MGQIILYPSNWLYNAGVIGLMRVLEDINISPNSIINERKLPQINIQRTDDIFNKWKELTENAGYRWGGQKGYYANQTEGSIKSRINALFSTQTTNNSSRRRRSQTFVCSFCSKTFHGSKSSLSFVDQSFGNLLMSTRTTPNFFWALEKDLFCCQKCEFILMCHHLAFITLGDGSEIFINAPSFDSMWYLNKFVREVYAKEDAKTKRELLGMSIIEYATKVQHTLGMWTIMNIEIVSKYKDYIDFFSLPDQTTKLLSDKEIAGLLSNTGEFKVFNTVLDGAYQSLTENGYRLLKVALKTPNERNKSEKKFLDSYLRLEKNKKDLLKTANKILKLYALIEQKINKEA